MRYKLTIAYDGTNYSGWQVQANAQSIQSLIQTALKTVLRHDLSVTGSGRTDAGVHAKGQTAHFDSDGIFDLNLLRNSLNALLPNDIRILEVHSVLPTFHARYTAKRKIYHYHLHLDAIADPFTKLYRHHILGKIDLSLIRKGANAFLGTHDFTSFANTKETKEENCVRTLYRLDIVEQNGGVRLEFEGNGFLYKMVRNITGTLIDVGFGKLLPEKIAQIFSALDRKKSGPAAPAQGLFLMQVVY